MRKIIVAAMLFAVLLASMQNVRGEDEKPVISLSVSPKVIRTYPSKWISVNLTITPNEEIEREFKAKVYAYLGDILLEATPSVTIPENGTVKTIFMKIPDVMPGNYEGEIKLCYMISYPYLRFKEVCATANFSISVVPEGEPCLTVTETQTATITATQTLEKTLTTTLIKTETETQTVEAYGGLMGGSVLGLIVGIALASAIFILKSRSKPKGVVQELS